ncbi:fimbria/pilus outer membrane usher protein [Kluyvera sp. STS39-E]|uniref:fimbria/pilus outer membrane usher protein n=1 Tax=Kluyvera sp. STS39-E TaxID=3234748 RepID=UPI0034C63B4A
MTLRAEPPEENTQYIAITVNQYPHDGLWKIRVADDGLWIAGEDAAKLGIAPQKDHAPWINLTKQKDIQVNYDSLQQQMSLTLPEASLTRTQQLEAQPPHANRPLMQAQAMGNLTLDYSLYSSETATQKQSSVQSQLQTSGWLPGQLSSSLKSQYQSGQSEERVSHTRLMTTWQYDSPEWLASVAVGDNITTGVSWSRQVRFGGLHLARNFQLDPQLNSAPRTQFSDSVVLPSTVDLYVDGLQQSHQQVTPGSYVLNTLPTFSGSGQAQVVITDINGQRREVTLDLYGAPQMLAEGLSSSSLDIGWLRQNYAEHSNDYAASPLLDAGWRYGLNNNLTVSAHTEQHQKIQNAGIASDWLPSPRAGIFSNHLATSQSAQGDGVKWGVGYQWNSQGLGFSASTSRSNAAWSDIARLSGSLPIQRNDTVWLSQTLANWGTLGIGWVRQDSARYLNASWSKSFKNQSSATLGFTHTLSTGDKTIQLMFSIPLGRKDSLSLQLGRQSTRLDYRHQPDYQQGGWSWQVSQNSGSTRQEHADVGYLNENGEWHIGLDRDNTSDSRYLSAEGSFMLLDKQAYALRYNRQGIALVSTNGISDVPIAIENRPAGKTDKNGYLLLTDLPRYHNAKISLDPLNLPPDIVTPLTEMYANPGKTEAVKVDFQVHQSQLVTAQVFDEQHRPLPVGSPISFPGGESIVGRDGFIWLENPPMPGLISIRLPSGTCSVALPFAARSTTTSNLGSLLCH